MSITTREHMRRIAQRHYLIQLGFSPRQADELRRISLTLRRWHERECGINGGCIERDDLTEKPYWKSEMTGRRYAIPDRERGALKRLGHILGLRNTATWGFSEAPAVHEVAITAYIQTDPRGAALYLIRPGDVPNGEDVGSYYSRGVCIY